MRNIILFTLLHLSFFTSYKGQTYNFKHYTEEEELAQSYIYCISQSREGLLTLSTGETITWFDGNKFTSLSNKDLIENIGSAHFIDSHGITWIMHQQTGLSYVRNGHYFRFTDKIISGLKVFQIIEDEKGTRWLATSGGVFKMDLNLTVTAISFAQNKSVNTISFDDSRHLLLGTAEGLVTIEITNATANVTVIPELLKDKNIKQIIRADLSKLNYWIAVEGDGVYGFTSKKGRYEITTHISAELNAGNFNTACIYSDKSKNLWISIFGDGLRKITFKENGLYDLYKVEKISKLNGLKSDNIQSIFQDSEGNMWFGTFGEGLIKKPVELFSFYGANEGITVTDVKKVIMDLDGNLWMGTNMGLAVLKKQTKTYTLYDASNGFINDKINALFTDRLGVLWIGTNENGIYKYNPTKNKFENFSKSHKLNHLSINVIVQAENTIMVGTTDGLYVFDESSKLTEELTTNDGLFHNNVLNIFKDSKERLWISSYGTPPYYIKDQKITSFKKIKGLNYFNINAVCEDKHGNIWIATEGDGVFKFDNTNFRQYTKAQGLVSDYCVGIETDRNNAIWVTHRNGSSELKQSHEKFIGFTNQKGLLYYENNLNAIFKDHENNLWFGTAQGIVMYDARSGTQEMTAPEIFISKIQLNEDAYVPGDLIKKEYSYYLVHIDYKAISLADPGAIYYKYRLLDVDTSYRTTDMPYVDFPKLGDGVYTFEVIACNANTGLCSAVPSKIVFTINKPVWKEIWFYLLLLFLIVLFMNVIVILRTRSLKNTQALLERKIEEKTYLLQREKEAVEVIKVQLEHKNKDITDSIHYAKNIQDSLLPPDELMNELFTGNYFVVYKPKDIVSGDFYWCSGPEQNCDDPLHFAAVIDCTGHGVPGAFLSILANDFLKQSAAEKNVNKPNDILDYLNENVSSHLNQQWSKNKIRDGMDIALVGIDYKNSKLYYSGANNPIYVFRQGENELEEMIIKATKQAIGSVNELIVKYELQVLDLIKGDTIYLFSDGYADQFGGPRNKKITYKSFRNILTEAFHLPMSQQKEYIENKLDAWKLDTEQTDDICVLGIRF